MYKRSFDIRFVQLRFARAENRASDRYVLPRGLTSNSVDGF